jgi:hypothetical protein
LGLCDDADCTPVGDDWPVAAGDDRAAVQPNSNSERGNAALCVVRGERSPAKWNCVVTQCRGVVGNTDRGRQLYLRRGSFGLHHSHAADGDEDINPHRGFRPGSASDHEPVAASEIRATVQPNPDGERGNTALCVVRGERSPAKWNCVVTQCRLLSGTPTQSGTITFTVMVTDSTATGAQTATERFDLTVE